MRTCPRCKAVMEEDNYILDQGVPLSDLLLVQRNKDYTKTKYPLKAAICPKCGHVELYVSHKEKAD